MRNMLLSEAKLQKNIFDIKALSSGATRDGFGRGVVEAGEKNSNVVVLCADLMESTRSQWFFEKFPERYIELGVAEQNLAAVASGMAAVGKIPFITSYAAFNPGRNNEQIRTTISLNDVPVKVCGMHAGVSVGPDGATHQALEDIALMRVQPNMTVVVPCDVEEARKATIAAAESGKPIYLRFAREKTPILTTPETPFEIGKALRVWDSPKKESKKKIGIISCGNLLYNALMAAKELEETYSIPSVVVHMHTIKPLDTDMLDSLTEEVEGIVSIEEHQVVGGLGSAIAEYYARTHPMKQSFIGVHDRFGQSGDPADF